VEGSFSPHMHTFYLFMTHCNMILTTIMLKFWRSYRCNAQKEKIVCGWRPFQNINF